MGMPLPSSPVKSLRSRLEPQRRKDGGDGGYSQFAWMIDIELREVGAFMVNLHGGNGGSGRRVARTSPLPFTEVMVALTVYRVVVSIGGKAENHTTRDFGEPSGKRNAGGGTGCSHRMKEYHGGESDYEEGSGESFNRRQDSYVGGKGGGGYGGGAGGTFGNNASTRGGDGTVVIRYWAYEE